MSLKPRFVSRALLALVSGVVALTACSSDGDARDAAVDAAVDVQVDATAVDTGGEDASRDAAGDVEMKRDAGVDARVSDATSTDAGAQDAGGLDGGALRVVKVVASSAGHACALRSDGRVRCWGLNDNGQLGRPASQSASQCLTRPGGVRLPCDPRAVEVAGVTDAVDLVTSAGATCVLRQNRSVLCWGANEAGQLGQGRGSTAPTATPTAVTLGPVRSLSAGAYHVCAALEDGTVRCWGSNAFGQTGVAIGQSPAQCDEGDGTLSPCTPTPTAVAGVTDAVEVAAGRFYTCARRRGGAVQCWGLNDSAQLGNGQVGAIEGGVVPPVTVAGETSVSAIFAGGSHGCAQRSTGALVCWGWDGYGQLLGAPSAQCSSVSGAFLCAMNPSVVPQVTNPRSVATGRSHACVVTSDGNLLCGGRNDNEQLGAATSLTCSVGTDTYPCSRNTPVRVQLSNVRQVSVGDYHSCALLDSGEVRCWGWNVYGQTGGGVASTMEPPALVRDLL
ncbi:MAG: hypothetical protein JNK72_04965 [Myxococcales bacterium]|nr:hypothetical protein [Myxococcales bacterium]